MSEVLSYLQFQEAMDAVNPKAVKKKFKNRKDKDIDNDGDVDSSDKYLHKRRKAISKAVKKDDVKEEKKCPPGQYYCEKSGKCKPNSMKEDSQDALKRMMQTRDNLKKQGNSAGLAAMELRIKKFRDSMKKESFGLPNYDTLQKMLAQRRRMKAMGQNTDAISDKIKKARIDYGKMLNKQESLDEKGKGLYYNINKKRKEGRPMRKKGEKGAPSEDDFKSAAKTAKESQEWERENCHSKDHDCATLVEHIVWGIGKPLFERHAVPDDSGYVAWYDIEFEHGVESAVPTEDLKIYTTEAHEKKDKDKKKMLPAKKGKHADEVDEDKEKEMSAKKSMQKRVPRRMTDEPAYERDKNHYKKLNKSSYSDSEISRAVDIAKKMAGGNYTGAYKKIEGIKKGLAQQGKVKYALKKAAESFETWKGLSISEVNNIVQDITSSAQDYIKLVEDGDLKSVDEPEVEPVKGMPLSFKQFKSKIGD